MAAEIDVVARVLAVLGLLTSATSLMWQFVNHRLTGARIRCELRLALYDEADPSGTLDVPAHRSHTDLAWVLEADREEFPHEGALITVRNRGRTAVSVHFPVLTWDGHHYSGVGTQPRGFDMPTGFCRLEPGEAKQWLTPIWASLHDYRTANPEALVTVRAAVQLGTGRWCRSARRNAWIVPPGVTSFGQTTARGGTVPP
ncbi:hypothetical protein Acor_57430 [Acrocarpospora corrugata]|uniref:Uncharacterized protein n=1 Tax=Acrocarpospora corrugata TaxID=35763 RepID=A0A5M3W3P5_9ACTN|nr:hypothetical protein [Acrocarpospora corrugata]GES03677.1 hypothetical protein Acor_57430 [Acrocarpospora corrugata]